MLNALRNKLHDNGFITVGTHNGKFHCDEAMACAIVALWADKHIKITRTRDLGHLDECDLVFDVGGKNAGKWHDHHVPGFTDTHNNGAPIASAGQAWRLFGKAIISECWLDVDNGIVADVWDYIDEQIITPIDMVDSGVKEGLGDFHKVTISGIISTMNQRDIAGLRQDEVFINAVSLLEQWLDKAIDDMVADKLDELRFREYVAKSSDGVVALPEYIGFGATMHDHPEALDGFKVVVYPDANAPGVWRIQTLPESADNGFSQRCPAPADLAGYRWDHTNPRYLANCPVTFVHKARFIGGVEAEDMTEAVEAAKKWIARSDT